MILIFIIILLRAQTTKKHGKTLKKLSYATTSIITRWFDGNRFCSGRWRCPFANECEREKKTSGICIDAVVAVMDIIWPFVSYLRRQFRVTKEAAMQYTNPIQFGSVTSFGCLWECAVHSHRNKSEENQTKQKETLQTEGFSRRWFSLVALTLSALKLLLCLYNKSFVYFLSLSLFRIVVVFRICFGHRFVWVFFLL